MNTIDKILQTREFINTQFFGKKREILSRMLSDIAKKTSIVKLNVNAIKQNS